MALKSNHIFVNLPVKDLPKTRAFFEQVGFEFNEQFSDRNAACLIIGDNIYAMLLVESYFRTFTGKTIADTATSTEVLLGISAGSREQVDEIVNKAFAAGATGSQDPVDHGFMYTWSFQDVDGHQWEVMYMDPSAVQQA